MKPLSTIEKAIFVILIAGFICFSIYDGAICKDYAHGCYDLLIAIFMKMVSDEK